MPVNFKNLSSLNDFSILQLTFHMNQKFKKGSKYHLEDSYLIETQSHGSNESLELCGLTCEGFADICDLNYQNIKNIQ